MALGLTFVLLAQVGEFKETIEKQKFEAATTAALLQQTLAEQQAAALREGTAARVVETLRKTLDIALGERAVRDARHVAATAQAAETLRFALAERDAAVEQGRVLGQNLAKSQGKLAGSHSQLQLHASSPPCNAQVGYESKPLWCWTREKMR